MTIAEKLHAAVQEAAIALWPIIELPGFDVVAPPSPEFGDFSTALPLTLAKIAQESPMSIAQKLQTHLQTQSLGFIKDITTTAPGYVNFLVDFSSLSEHLIQKILTQKHEYGTWREDKGKVLVEHTAINPNKAAHVGNLRNACLGDTVANILRTTGYQVEVQNYIDDTGAQVADILVAMENLPDKQGSEPFDYYCWNIYTKIHRMYEVDEKLVARRKEILKLTEEGNNETAQKALEIANQVVDRHLQTMSRLNIAYNLLVWERDIIDLGLWPTVFEKLKQKKLIKQPWRGVNKGAWIVEFGSTDREHKILVKSDGVATYTAKDLAYQLWKFGLLPIDFEYFVRTRQWNNEPLLTTAGGTLGIENLEPAERHFQKPNKVINVIDVRQSYPQEVIKETLTKLGYADAANNSIHLDYNVVKLSLGAVKELGIRPEVDKTEYAMSGREGIGVKIDDLMDKIEEKIAAVNPNLLPTDVQNLASSTLRYYMLRNRLHTEIIFDFDEALRTDGNTGVYLQYAYARSCNILNKVEQWRPLSQKLNIPAGLSLETKGLLKAIEEYPGALRAAETELDPSLLTDYAFALASQFAKFYEKNPVLSADPETKNFRLHLVASVKQILENLLEILGIIPLPKI
ncbi:MAG: arginine--tRNA ligase [Patescibacteria group bacterium]|jgi:arginyl-tRNA synthetase